MKKLLTLLLTLGLLLSLCACGGAKDNGADSKVIKVAATAVPHAEILEKAKEVLAKDGWDLKVTVYNDYVQPIQVVESGEMDANYFAHEPYLNNFNDEQGTTQTLVCKVHSEPMGIYTGKVASLQDLKEKDEILVPNDGTNETRALKLLEANGVIVLPEGTTDESLVTVKDLTDDNYLVKGIVIKEAEAATIPHILQDAALAVLNGNYAMEAGITDKGIAFEAADSDRMVTYVNVLACKADHKDSEAVQALAKVLRSDEIKNFIQEKYNGTVIFFEGE